MDNYNNYDGRRRGVAPYNNGSSLLDFNSYTPEFVGRPIEQIGNMINTMGANNKAIVDKTSAIDIALANADINPVDEHIRQQQKQVLKAGVDDIISSKNYAMVDANVNRLVKSYATNDAYNKALANQQAYAERKDKLEKLYLNKTITKEQYDMYMQEPAKPTELDINSGRYTKNEYGLPVNAVDVNPTLARIVTQFPTTTNQGAPIPVFQEKGNPYDIKYFTQGTEEFRNKKRLEESMIAALEAEDGTKAFIDEQAKALGITSRELEENLIKSHLLYGGEKKIVNSVLQGNIGENATARLKQSFENSKNTSGAHVPLGAVKSHSDNSAVSDIIAGLNTTPHEKTGVPTYNTVTGQTYPGTTKVKYDPFIVSPTLATNVPKFNNWLKNVKGKDYDFEYMQQNPEQFKYDKDKIIKAYEEYTKETIDGPLLIGFGTSVGEDEGKDLTYNTFGQREFVTRGSDGKYQINAEFQEPWRDMETGDVIKGVKFKDYLSDKFSDDKLTVRTYKKYDANSPIGLVSGDFAFGEGEIVMIGGKQFARGTGGSNPYAAARSVMTTAATKYGQPIDAAEVTSKLISMNNSDGRNEKIDYKTVDDKPLQLQIHYNEPYNTDRDEFGNQVDNEIIVESNLFPDDEAKVMNLLLGYSANYDTHKQK